MASSLPHFPPFSIIEDQKSAGLRWRKWLNRFETFMIAYDVTAEKRKRALLLHLAGDEVQTVFEGLANTGNPDQYQIAVDKLNEFFVPSCNAEYEIIIFRQARQEQGESIDAFHSRLRRLATGCAFHDADKEIKLQIMETCRSSTLRTKALLNKTWSLQKLLETARMLDLVTEQTAKLELSDDATSKSNTLFAIDVGKRSEGADNSYRKERYPTYDNRKCYFCAKTFPHPGGRRNCPARQVICHICKREGHFARCCQDKLKDRTPTTQKFKKDKNFITSVGAVLKGETEGTSSDESVFALGTGSNSRLWLPIELNNTVLDMLIDTGAAVNIIPHGRWEEMTIKPELKKVENQIFGFAAEKPLTVIGQFMTNVKYGGNTVEAKFYVIKDENNKTFPLLGFETSLKLKILRHTMSIGEQICKRFHWCRKVEKLYSQTTP